MVRGAGGAVEAQEARLLTRKPVGALLPPATPAGLAMSSHAMAPPKTKPDGAVVGGSGNSPPPYDFVCASPATSTAASVANGGAAPPAYAELDGGGNATASTSTWPNELQKLIEMGFEADKAMVCLVVSNGDLDQATRQLLDCE